MALTNLEAAVNKLHSISLEWGVNNTKKADLDSASTSLAAAIASDSTLDGDVAIASVKEAIDHVAFALATEKLEGNGSGVPVMSEKIYHDYFHVAQAYAKAKAAFDAPGV